MVETAQAIAELGWAGITILIVLVATIGLYRRWWVPGWVFEAERDRRKRAEAAAERYSQAFLALARRANLPPSEPFEPYDPLH